MTRKKDFPGSQAYVKKHKKGSVFLIGSTNEKYTVDKPTLGVSIAFIFSIASLMSCNENTP